MSESGRRLFTTELVASVLSNLPRNKRHLSAELRKIHPALFRMKGSCPITLGDLVFDMRGTFPYCEDIDQAFSNLETAKVLPRTNPDLDRYEIGDALRRYYRRYVRSKLTPQQLEEVGLMVTELTRISSR